MFNKSFLIGLLTICGLSFSLFAQQSEQKSLAVTVYNNNLGVVKDLRSFYVNSGKSVIKVTDVAQFIDPTSVHIKFDGQVMEQNYQYDLVSMDKILQKYIDKKIQLIGKNGEFIEGILLSSAAGQLVLQKDEGGLIMLPSLSEYRISVGSLPDGLITRPTLVWLVESKSSGKQDVEISYQTSGMNWHAEYVAVLNEDDTKLDLNSWVSIENISGTSYNNATLKLVAGDVNLVQDRNKFQYDQYQRYDVMKSVVSEQQFAEEQFFEYHIYNLQRPATLLNSETKQISLFEASGVKATKKFLYRSGGWSYYGDNQNKKVAVIVEFENKEANNLGLPMPKGKVRVYKSDGKAIEFIGEDLIDHTPKDETLKLKIGDAFDILAEEIQTENNKISDRVYEQAFEITIKNRKKENVVVEVEKNLGFYWNIISTSIDYKKKDASTITFQVPASAESETVLKIKVRYTY
ncbi:MAG: DUF4139 domain-containing protein [Ignavibacteriaceae bacterium]|nr:DUF4139 domain-containing protein [Ignavibacteriaceae bacterium]